MDIRTVDKDRSHKRELLIDDKVVSWLWVFDYQMRIGTAQVRMAGIGGVNTNPEHRKKGYMRILFEDTVRYMIDQGYDVSMLFGIENFYTKFGYASCLPSYKQTVQTRDAEDVKAIQGNGSSYTMRALEPEDMEAVLALYNKNNATRTGTIVRSIEHFTKFSKGTRWGVPPEAFVFVDQAGQIGAYIVADKSDRVANSVEVGSADDALFAPILAALADRAIEKRCGEITLHQPRNHAFAEYMERFGCKWDIQCSKNGGGMMRILSLDSLFDKVRPELERRVAAAHQGSNGSLTVETDIGTVTFTIERGKVALSFDQQAKPDLCRSQDKLIQMLIGYRRSRDVLNDSGVRTSGDAIPLLDVLFPTSQAYVWRADHF